MCIRDRVHSAIAAFRLIHQISVSCSAHPGFKAIIFISSEGEYAVARHLPDSPSITEALTEELPKSIPSSNIYSDLLCIIFYLKCLKFEVSKVLKVIKYLYQLRTKFNSRQSRNFR